MVSILRDGDFGNTACIMFEKTAKCPHKAGFLIILHQYDLILDMFQLCYEFKGVHGILI